MKAYQVKIEIKNSHPPIWRRCVIPSNFTFSQLSVVLNMIMGWSGSHLSDYEFRKQRISISEEKEDADFIWGGYQQFQSQDTYLRDFIEGEEWFTYTYDFGDQWEHRITLEKVVIDYDKPYPCVLKYKGNCPPEDCGGIDGYYTVLQSNNTEEQLEDNTIDYNMDDVNEELEETCFLRPEKVEKRDEQSIYRDFDNGTLGLFSKISHKKRSHQPRCASKTLDQLVKFLEKESWTETLRGQNTLEENLRQYDKESLKCIADDKKIIIKSHDTKEGIVQKIVKVMMNPKVIETYLLCMKDDEVRNVQKAAVKKTLFVNMKEDDFPVLYAGAYAAYADGWGIAIPVEITNRLNQMYTQTFVQRRIRCCWLLDCMKVATVLYGIVPIRILMTLFNQHKKYRTTSNALIEEIKKIPQDIFPFVLEGTTIYTIMAGIDDDVLLNAQDDKPFYIPSIKEIEDLSCSYIPDSPYIRNLEHCFLQVFHYPEDGLLDLVSHIYTMSLYDDSLKTMLDFLEEEGIILTDDTGLEVLTRALVDLSNHTRKLVNRGFMPVELSNYHMNDKNSSPHPSNIIYVNDWKHGK
jgi:hypothetical protein